MARSPRTDRVDAGWPKDTGDEHPVTELVAAVQGSLSPFGDLSFPLRETPYEHPVTVINR